MVKLIFKRNKSKVQNIKRQKKTYYRALKP